MKKTVFWLGVIILVVGVILFGYGYMTIQNMKAAYEPYLDLQFAFHPELIQQWDLAILLRWIGLGMLILGAIVLAYGLWVKKESK